MNKRELIIIGCLVVGILALLLGSMLEYREVSDLDWNKRYTFDSKDPYGAWMFDKMVKTYFDSNNVAYHYKDTLLSEMDTTDVLYIMFGKRFTYRSEEANEIFDFVKTGNNALIIGKATWLDDTTYYVPDSYGYTNKDSILNFQFEEDDTRTVYRYEHYDKTLKEKASLSFNSFYYGKDEDNYSLGSVNDSLSVYTKTKIDDGSIYQHSVPEIFINHAAKQAYYRDYINEIFKEFDPQFVVLDHPSFNRIRNVGNTDSPLQFVLSQKSLKTAYYLLLVVSLLFVIFKSKRKQRAIPILEKNKNTTLEYVETLSNLFSSQGQSARLIPHIKNYFYHTVKRKYDLDEKNPDFVKLLSKKSKFDQEELQVIVNMLNNSDKGYAYPDDQLINLHRRVENFYKTAK